MRSTFKGIKGMLEQNFKAYMSFGRPSQPSFYGHYDPIAAERWIMELEKIFEVLESINAQKVTFVTYMLEVEAKHWWRGAH